jgi:pilus assembly protein TadC
MNLLKYTSTNELKISRNSDVFIDVLKKSILDKLHDMGISSELSDDTIIFRRFVIIGTNTGENKKNQMKIFREGKFRIRKNSSKKIEVYSEIELDHLLVLSIMIGISGGFFIGVPIGFSLIAILSSVIGGFVLSIVVYLFGANSILATLNEILETSLAKTQRSI